MKKTIVIVSSIVLLLGVNFASAMKVLPPLAIAEPLNAFEQQIWSDIQILQNQISNLAQRLTVVEQKPTIKTLKVFDANNKLVGYLNGTAYSPYYQSILEIYDINRKEFIYIRKDGSIEPSGSTAWYSTETWYSEPNCEGTPYISNIEYQIVTSNFQGYYLTLSNSSAIHLAVSNTTDLINAQSKKSGPQGCTVTNVPNHVVRTFEYDPLNFTGPLEIRAE